MGVKRVCVSAQPRKRSVDLEAWARSNRGKLHAGSHVLRLALAHPALRYRTGVPSHCNMATAQLEIRGVGTGACCTTLEVRGERGEAAGRDDRRIGASAGTVSSSTASRATLG
jgi:hypothetical protein